MLIVLFRKLLAVQGDDEMTGCHLWIVRTRQCTMDGICDGLKCIIMQDFLTFTTVSDQQALDFCVKL